MTPEKKREIVKNAARKALANVASVLRTDDAIQKARGNSYRPSADELERIERDSDRLDMFRAEY